MQRDTSQGPLLALGLHLALSGVFKISVGVTYLLPDEVGVRKNKTKTENPITNADGLGKNP